MLIRAHVAFAWTILLSCTPGFSHFEESETTWLRSLPFCEVARNVGVPAELVAGVFFFENRINRNVKDTVQDTAFRIMLKGLSKEWWDEWASKSMTLASSRESATAQANRWPAEVAATGLVISLGPAQITPRTALLACKGETLLREASSPLYTICEAGVRNLIESILDERKSIELSALILRYEAHNHYALTGTSVIGDLGTWATLYNRGGYYYRNGKNSGSLTKLGGWVAENRVSLRELVNCKH
jgi:hypothetical protein